MMQTNPLKAHFVPIDRWRMFRWLEQIHPVLIVFVVLIVNRFSLTLNGGEEHYLSYALQYYNPEWIPGSFTFTEFPGTRLLFQAITGFFVDRFGFHATAITGRLLVYLMISFPLVRIFREFRFTNLWMLVFIQLFLQTKQSFFADEWIFWGFEPKSVAYIFIFWGLLFFLKKRFVGMAIVLACATWFHLLVGGWFVIGVAIAMIVLRVPFREMFKTGLVYGALMLPLLVYLWPLISAESLHTSAVNLKQVYCYFRLKHHIGLFDTYDYFVSKHLAGVVIAFLVLLAQFPLLRRTAYPVIRRITILNILFLALALCFVVVAWVDKAFMDRSGGMGLMYYPFRMMGISLFVTMLQGIWLLRESRRYTRLLNTLLMLSVVASFTILGVRAVLNINANLKAMNPDPLTEEFFKAVEEFSQPGDLFILLTPDYPTTTAFSRMTGRDNYVVFKYVPAGTAKLGEWYRRLMIEQEMNAHHDRIGVVAMEEGIQFVVASKPLETTGLQLIWHSKPRFVYRVSNQGINKE